MAKIITLKEIISAIEKTAEEATDLAKKEEMTNDLADLLCCYAGGWHSPAVVDGPSDEEATAAFHWDKNIQENGEPFAAFDRDVNLEEWKKESNPK